MDKISDVESNHFVIFYNRVTWRFGQSGSKIEDSHPPFS